MAEKLTERILRLLLNTDQSGNVRVKEEKLEAVLVVPRDDPEVLWDDLEVDPILDQEDAEQDHVIDVPDPTEADHDKR